MGTHGIGQLANDFCRSGKNEVEEDIHGLHYIGGKKDFFVVPIIYVQGPPNTFFLENALKKTTEYFLKFLFYLKV